MTKALAEALVAALHECGLGGSVMADYSGRGMAGKTTHAVVCDGWSELLRAALSCPWYFLTDHGKAGGVVDPAFTFEAERGFASDSLGRRMVVY